MLACIAVHCTINHDSDAPVGLDAGSHRRCPCFFLLPPINATWRLNFPARAIAQTQRLHEQFICATGSDYLRIIDAHFRQVCMNWARGKPVAGNCISMRAQRPQTPAIERGMRQKTVITYASPYKHIPFTL
ncbi:hypothetical protein [Stenotrophomonas rhizophila]